LAVGQEENEDGETALMLAANERIMELLRSTPARRQASKEASRAIQAMQS
jgi:hypothetical protein